jgi:hypothetical protein
LLDSDAGVDASGSSRARTAVTASDGDAPTIDRPVLSSVIGAGTGPATEGVTVSTATRGWFARTDPSENSDAASTGRVFSRTDD